MRQIYNQALHCPFAKFQMCISRTIFIYCSSTLSQSYTVKNYDVRKVWRYKITRKIWSKKNDNTVETGIQRKLRLIKVKPSDSCRLENYVSKITPSKKTPRGIMLFKNYTNNK